MRYISTPNLVERFTLGYSCFGSTSGTPLTFPMILPKYMKSFKCGFFLKIIRYKFIIRQPHFPGKSPTRIKNTNREILTNKKKKSKPFTLSDNQRLNIFESIVFLKSGKLSKHSFKQQKPIRLKKWQTQHYSEKKRLSKNTNTAENQGCTDVLRKV